MFRLYRDGATLAAVGETFGVSRERVRQIFRDAGLPTRSVAEASKLQSKNDDELGPSVAERLRETGDLEYVAAEFGLTEKRTKALLHRAAPELLTPSRRAGDRVPMGFWTRDRIIDAIQRWNDLYGKPPNATDWNPAMARRLGHDERVARFEEGLWPHVNTVQRVFDGWNVAIRAAGLQPTKVSSYGRPGDDPETVMEAVEHYRAGCRRRVKTGPPAPVEIWTT